MSTELPLKVKNDLNILADMMLMLDGYESCFVTDPESGVFDCSTSTMQRCQKAWNKALTSYVFLNKKPELLKHQVEITASHQMQLTQG